MNSFNKLSAKILLVEDDAMNQFIAKKFLVKWGYDVVVANNGIEAVEKVQTKLYDLVLMDMHMPEMDGTEAARIIRLMDGEYFKNLPMIAFSAVVETKEKAAEIGMNDFASKPINPIDLQEKIRRYLSIADATQVERKLHMDFDMYTDGDDNFKQELGSLMITNLHDLSGAMTKARDKQNIDVLHLVLHKVKPTLCMLNDPDMNSFTELLKSITLNDAAYDTLNAELKTLILQMIRAIEHELSLEPVVVLAAKAA